jgi:hypothetical protein
VAPDLLIDDAYHVERAPRRAPAFRMLLIYEVAPDIDGEELGVKAAFLHPFQIGMRLYLAVRLDAAGRKVVTFVEYGGGYVVVRIDDYRLAVKAFGPRAQLGIARLTEKGRGHNRDKA